MAAGGVLVGRGYVSIRPEFEGDWSRQVSARASSAGRSGGGAFGKAFGAVVSGGLRGIVGGFGTTLAAGIAPAAGAIAVLAPALATAGAAAGALKLGLSGVGEAFKAAFADTSSQASSAASATKAVESAQRGLASAQRALADARVQAAKRVADAQREVRDAERDLADAQRDARDVQEGLNDARREAARALEDMNTRLAESRLDEREAVLRLKEAEDELRAAQRAPGTDPDELARLQLAYERARLNLTEQRTETKRLATDTAAANKAGVEGSEQVVAARQRIAEANQTVADKERALADAQRGVSEARADGARQVEDAQRAVADAAAAVASAQAAAAGQASKFDEAMAKLAPNARSFVTAVRGLGPAWDAMRLGVQNSLFQGLDTTVTQLGRSTIPVLHRQLTGTATVWNQIAKNAAAGIQEMAKSGMLDQILKGATDNLAVFKNTPKQLITAFGQLTVAAQPAFNQLLTGFAGAITSFTDGLSKSFASGGLKTAIDTAFGILSQLGGILGDALGAVGNIMKAASDSGSQALAVVGELFAELRRITAMPEIQSALRTIFASIAQIAAAIAPVIGSVLKAILPLIAAIAPVIAQLATALGPVLSELAGALGRALAPIIQGLLPIITLVGDAIIQIITAVTPLLEPIGQLIGAILQAVMPVLKPIIDIILQVVDALVGPLNTIIQAFIPYIGLLGEVMNQVFGALKPLIQPLVGIIGMLAGVFAGLYVQLIQTFMQVIVPLLPALTDLVGVVVKLALQVLSALMPSLNELIGAGLQLLNAVLPLLPMFAQLAAMLLTLAAGVLAKVLPPLIDFAGWLISGLVGAITSVIGWVSSLVTWLRKNLGPAFSWLNTNVVQPVWKAIRTAIRAAWENGIRPAFTLIKGGINGVGTVFRWLRDRAVKPVWDGIKRTISTVWNEGIRPAFDKLKSAIGKVGDAFRIAKDAIKTAWDKIRDATKKPINFVLNTVWNNGIVKAWDKILGWIPGLPKLKKLPLLAQGGTVPAQPGVFNRPTAIVGEGRSQYPEFVIPTDPRYRGRALSLWEAAGGQLMADGGILGDIWGGIKNVAGKVGGAISTAASFLKDPGKALDKLMGGLLKPLQAIKNSAFGKMTLALPKSILKGLKDIVTGGGAASVGPGPGSGVQRWRGVVRQALGLVGQPLSYDNITLRRMNQESGGNPTIVNKWDSNWIAGYPSVGLMQVIRPTFQRHAGRFRNTGPFSYGVSTNPLANVYASMRYALAAYGSLPRAYNRAGGYDAGGWLPPGVTTAVNATGRPEAVLTDVQWRTMQAAASSGSLDAMTVNVWVGNEQIRDITRAEVRTAQGELIQVLNAS